MCFACGILQRMPPCFKKSVLEDSIHKLITLGAILYFFTIDLINAIQFFRTMCTWESRHPPHRLVWLKSRRSIVVNVPYWMLPHVFDELGQDWNT
ncbi:hypothetical protein H5410_031336 [Solanum commersonii]|uniref:Uncharacterized protein n=1 Tax=Solanum commersonii TaxID=4109 RepID=A0A9J5YM05_SOLCO|nr:hypothetical protein H5410_031336 [Solanum commersonii]